MHEVAVRHQNTSPKIHSMSSAKLFSCVRDITATDWEVRAAFQTVIEAFVKRQMLHVLGTTVPHHLLYDSSAALYAARLLIIPHLGATHEHQGIRHPFRIADIPLISQKVELVVYARRQSRIFYRQRKPAEFHFLVKAVTAKRLLKAWTASRFPIAPLANASILPAVRASRSSDSPASSPR